eukprot:443244-Pyramimonas_sp.AAC.2
MHATGSPDHPSSTSCYPHNLTTHAIPSNEGGCYSHLVTHDAPTPPTSPPQKVSRHVYLKREHKSFRVLEGLPDDFLTNFRN